MQKHSIHQPIRAIHALLAAVLLGAIVMPIAFAGAATDTPQRPSAGIKKQLKQLKQRIASLEQRQAPAALPPTGPAGGDLTGAYPNPQLRPSSVGSPQIGDEAITESELAPNSIGGRHVSDDQLGGADIDERTLGAVGFAETAAQGGIGRYAFAGTCDPGSAYAPCVVRQIFLPTPARVLVMGTLYATPEVGTEFGVGQCRIGTTNGPILESALPVSLLQNQAAPEHIPITVVTDPLTAGTHSIGIDCIETAGDVHFHYPRLSVVALSAE